MTLDLSKKIQAAILAVRAYTKAEVTATRQTRVLMRLESKVGAEISGCKARLASVESDSTETNSSRQDIEHQHNILTLLLEDVQGRQQIVQTQLESPGDYLRDMQATQQCARRNLCLWSTGPAR